MTAIFQSTSQALHVSFLVMSNEPRQKNVLRQALIRHIEELRNPSPGLLDWLSQLRGESSGTVNFGGLNMEEIRAQCAMVTQIVQDHLPAPEMHVIRARNIPSEAVEVGKDDERRPIYDYRFSGERQESFRFIADWLNKAGAYNSIGSTALLYLVSRSFAERREVRASFREISKECGANYLIYYRLYPKVKEAIASLEGLATARLTHHFERTGLVESGFVDTSREVKVWRFAGGAR